MENSITFDAEIKKVTSKKLASLDMEYQVVLSSQDLNLYALGEFPAETLLKVTVEPYDA